LQRVTLGGTGKETGDRHPKIADNVLIGACSTVLGNITIGEGALIAPGSLVLKPVPAYAMVAGAPAKQVGQRVVPLLVSCKTDLYVFVYVYSSVLLHTTPIVSGTCCKQQPKTW
jgi:serine acetyltransferase